MTDKRFRITQGYTDRFCHDWQNNQIFNFRETVELLNELYETNERLEEYNNKLMKQPLLFDIQTIPNTMEIIEVNNQLEKENEQLREEIKDMKIRFKRKYDYEFDEIVDELW